jgi:NAD-dependent dihydropyrimidine dehydrogenase PreA subunit
MDPFNLGGLFMETKTRKKRKAVVDEKNCVACGCCRKVCPKGAIAIWKGIMAKVDMETCVGCGKCAKECPASIIEVQEV